VTELTPLTPLLVAFVFFAGVLLASYRVIELLVGPDPDLGGPWDPRE